MRSLGANKKKDRNHSRKQVKLSCLFSSSIASRLSLRRPVCDTFVFRFPESTPTRLIDTSKRIESAEIIKRERGEDRVRRLLFE